METERRAGREEILEAFVRERPMPSVGDLRRWQTSHPEHALEILCFAADVIGTTVTGDGTPAREWPDIVAKLSRAVAPGAGRATMEGRGR